MKYIIYLATFLFFITTTTFAQTPTRFHEVKNFGDYQKDFSKVQAILETNFEAVCNNENNTTYKASMTCKTEEKSCGFNFPTASSNYDMTCKLLKKGKEVGVFAVFKTLDTNTQIIATTENTGIENNDKITSESKTGEVDTYKTLDISDKLLYKRIQQKSLSCESSATADILSYFLQEEILEDEILDQLQGNFYDLPATTKLGKRIWGNPNQNFVGKVDNSSQRLYTGYGVLEKPIAKIYENYGFSNKIINSYHYDLDYNQKDHLEELLLEIEKGNMVQLWGDWCTTPIYDDGINNTCWSLDLDRTMLWYYEDESGNLVHHYGLIGEHAFYLLGYEGSVNNPKKIIVRDTQTGKHSYPIHEWLRKWNLMQNRSIIIHKN